MFGLGTPELIVILAIAFLVFGGKKLPELGAGLGRGISSFKKGLKDVEESGKAAIEENIPGAVEVTAIKEEVSKIKNIG
jgi:sec-independent protein translocase protein TatA